MVLRLLISFAALTVHLTATGLPAQPSGVIPARQQLPQWQQEVARLEAEGDAFYRDMDYGRAALSYSAAVQALPGKEEPDFDRFFDLTLKYLIVTITDHIGKLPAEEEGEPLWGVTELVEGCLGMAAIYYDDKSGRYADFLYVKAVGQYALGKKEAAKDTMEECLELRDDFDGAYSAMLFLALWELESGAGPEILEFIESIVSATPFEPEPAAQPEPKEELYFNSRVVLCVALQAFDRPREGLQVLEQAMDRARRYGEKGKHGAANVGNLLYRAAYAAMQANENAVALNYARQLQDLVVEKLGKDHVLYSQALDTKANIYMRIGNYGLAEEYIQQSLSANIKRFGHLHPLVANGHALLANLYMSIGNYGLAEKHITSALDITDRVSGKDSPEYARYTWELGHVLEVRGKDTEAVALRTGVVEDLKNLLGKDHYWYRSFADQIIRNEANLEADEGAVRKLKSILERMGPGERLTVSYIKTLYELGNAYLQLGELEETAECWQNCITYLVDADLVGNELFIVVATKYAILAECMDYLESAAYFHYLSIHSVFENMDRNYMFLSGEDREIYWKKLKHLIYNMQDFAFRHADEMPELLSLAYDCELFGKNLLMDTSRKLSQIVLESEDGKWAVRRRLYLNAIEELEKEKAKKRAAPAREADRAGSAAAYLPDRADSLSLYIRSVEKWMISYAGEQHGLKRINSVDSDQIREALQEGQAAVEYIVCPDIWGEGTMIYWALMLTRDCEYTHAVPLGIQDEILDAVMSGEDEFPLGAIFQTLWEPLLPCLDGCDEVFVSLSGPLNTVPLDAAVAWAAISRGETPVSIRNLMSTGHLVEPSPSFSDDPTALLVGGLDYWEYDDGDRHGTDGTVGVYRGADRGQGYDFLPWSLREVTECARALEAGGWRTEVVTDRHGTRGKLLEYSGTDSPELLHISTHGFYFPHEAAAAAEPGKNKRGKDKGGRSARPAPADESMPTVFESKYRASEDPLMRTGLLLSGANQHIDWNWNRDAGPAAAPDTAREREYGIISAAEIASSWFGGTRLVVLSACDTGVGDADHSEGIYGLQRAFRMAGVRNMIVTLNRVPDRETCEFMTSFYEILSRGNTVADAFAAARRAMMEKYPERPHTWAAFKLIE